MHQVVNGLVIRSVDYKEADKILTVLTDRLGKITVGARGARRKGSRLSSASQLFAYSNMTLFENKGRYTLNEADTIDQFFDLTKDLDKMALASYIVEVLGCEEEGGQDLSPLRLGLNTLFALAEGEYDAVLVKAAFELRYAAISGYSPSIDMCAGCGEEMQGGFFDISSGMIFCKKCHRSGGIWLSLSAVRAVQYIVSCDLKRLFSFRLPQDDLNMLSVMSERYLLSCLERGFKTLDFYKSLGEAL